jgi:hypothetical protein
MNECKRLDAMDELLPIVSKHLQPPSVILFFFYRRRHCDNQCEMYGRKERITNTLQATSLSRNLFLEYHTYYQDCPQRAPMGGYQALCGCECYYRTALTKAGQSYVPMSGHSFVLLFFSADRIAMCKLKGETYVI